MPQIDVILQTWTVPLRRRVRGVAEAFERLIDDQLALGTTVRPP